MPIEKVNLIQKFNTFSDHWSPRVVGDLNGQYVKIVKIVGQFDWHFHEHQDELFWVTKGQMQIGLRDPVEREVVVGEGEIIVIPKGVEHRPASVGEETWIVIFEPQSTLNTGNLRNERTRDQLERI
jgi:mannose-6-phosphate isomerase-like protein (cupin superfamily)